MMKRGSFQMMKTVNKSLILNKIRLNQPISRAQIAKETKLTPPTVSSIVKELIDENLVKESSLGQSKGGRKPTMLEINNFAYYIIGLDIGPTNVHSMITDLSGNIITKTSTKISKNLTQKQFLSLLENVTVEIINKSKQNIDILGIGVAMHGVVDVDTGTSLFAPNLQLQQIPIKFFLESRFETPVYVENDARAMALGESWFGKHNKTHSMLVINLSTGVGAGFIINGELFHGDHDLAGEVGHMTIDIEGPLCECGNKGCFQTFATGNAIVRETNQIIGEEKYNNAEEIYHDAVNGDYYCINSLKKVGNYIGVALTNLIHIMNPEIIILGGGVTKSSKFLMPEIKETIQNRALTDTAKKTPVSLTSLGKNSTLYGAVSLVLKDVFE